MTGYVYLKNQYQIQDTLDPKTSHLNTLDPKTNNSNTNSNNQQTNNSKIKNYKDATVTVPSMLFLGASTITLLTAMILARIYIQSRYSIQTLWLEHNLVTIKDHSNRITTVPLSSCRYVPVKKRVIVSIRDVVSLFRVDGLLINNRFHPFHDRNGFKNLEQIQKYFQ
jgi:hypothetical protein